MKKRKVGSPGPRQPWALDRKRDARLLLHRELAREAYVEAAHVCHTLKTEESAMALKAAIDLFVKRRVQTR